MCSARSPRRNGPGPQTIERIAITLKAMSDPVRLRILYNLQEGELCVGDLVDRLDRSQANVSKHLAILRQSGLVASRAEGPIHYYYIADPMVEGVCDTVCSAVEARMSGQLRSSRF